MKKKVCLLLTVVMILSLCLSGCGSSYSSSTASNYASDSMGMATESANSYKGGISFSSGASKTKTEEYQREYSEEGANAEEVNLEKETKNNEEYVERKIVYSAEINAQTKDLNAARQAILNLIDETGAYIEKQSIRNNGDIYSRYQTSIADFVIRVPSKNFYTFIDGLSSDNIYINSMNQDSIDYSEEYYDKESRINSLRAQEERLLKLIDDAYDTQTIMQIEDRLSDVRYQIESLTKNLRFIDSRVDYSVISISISEVIKYDEPVEEPTNFIEELWQTIENSKDEFLDWGKGVLFALIYVLPYLIIALVVFFVIRAIVKGGKKRKLRKAQQNDERIRNQIKKDREEREDVDATYQHINEEGSEEIKENINENTDIEGIEVEELPETEEPKE